MSARNFKEEQEHYMSQSSSHPTSFHNSLHLEDLSKDSRMSHHNKENDPIALLPEMDKLKLQQMTASKSCTNLEKQKVIENMDPKKKDLAKLLKEISSPNSLNSSDLSYKIFNEILNTQTGEKPQVRAKMSNKSFEGKRQGPSLNRTAESAMDLLNSTKTLEDNEETKVLQEKIKYIVSQLQIRMDFFNSRKMNYEREDNRLKYSFLKGILCNLF